MANAIFGWQNRIATGLLSAGSAEASLPVSNLAGQQGSAAEAWQTASGALSSWFACDAGAAVSWRAFLLARTNLTPAATVRWRVGALESMADPTSYSLDNTAGASIGPSTTRVGSVVAADGSSVPVYRNSSASLSWVARNVTLAANVRYRWTMRAMRVAGSGTTGSLISASYHDGTGIVRATLSMAALLPSGEADYSVEFTNRVAGTYAMYMFTFVGPEGGDVALWSGRLTPIAEYDSGTIPSGVVPGGGQSFHLAPAEVMGQFCRCDISDAGNPDGCLRIALAYAGPVWQPSLNIGWGTSFAMEEVADEVVTRGGSEYSEPRYIRRRWDIALDAVAAADLWPRMMEWLRATRAGGNVLFVPDPASADVQREAVFGRARSMADVTYPFTSTELRAWRARVTERL